MGRKRLVEDVGCGRGCDVVVEDSKTGMGIGMGIYITFLVYAL